MKSGNIRLAFALVAISLFFALSPVLADNSMIPSSLISYRDSLLGERQSLLAQRSDANSRIATLETAKRQCDVFLAGDISKVDHDRLIGARAAVSGRINDLKSWLEDVQSDLLDVDACLRDCESRMTRWACLK